MKRIVAALALILPAVIPRAEIVLHDDRDRELVLNAPAQRIVSIAPHLTELLFAAGAGAKLVGTVAYSDYPEQAGRIPVVGNSASLDMERIVALKPDVVVAWLSGNPSGEYASSTG